MLTKLAAGAGAAPKLYIDDCFQVRTRTGTGANATITTVFQPDFVWLKSRNDTYDHFLYDTIRGATNHLQSDTTSAQGTYADSLTAFSATGYSLGANVRMNANATTYVDWVWKKAPKFFDVVTYTGTGTTMTVAHGLGVTPGMIIVKGTNAASAWDVYHRSLGNTQILRLSTTDAASTQPQWNDTDPTASVFTVKGGETANVSGREYVAYLFAHDTTTDGIIQCGSFTTDGIGNATVTLGWEPQWVLIKESGGAGDAWRIIDSSRGWTASAGGTERLFANTSEAAAGGQSNPLLNATGFSVASFGVNKTNIYLAIRRPNKPPTSGTQVYNAIARTGTGAAATVTGVGFAPDVALVTRTDTVSQYRGFFDRLRGADRLLRPSQTLTELDASATPELTAFGMDGVTLGTSAGYGVTNTSGNPHINHFFRRAPGVFDQVCYTGTGVAKTEAHNLGVVPELIIVKCRSAVENWQVYHSALGNTKASILNNTTVPATQNFWNNTTPAASVFSLGSTSEINFNGATYVAYLFATKAGISKVGSYTGNGSSQTINCGFTTGARFILIKRTDSTGDWFVWDSVRGIIAGNDPHLSLNTTAAEVTTDDSIDPDTSGFIVNQDAATNINVTSASYIFLSFA